MKNIFLAFACICSIGVLAQSNAIPATSPSAPPPEIPTSASPTPAPPLIEVKPAGFYYYCDKLRAYYPTVAICPEGWIAVPVGAPPPIFERHWAEPAPPETEETVRARPNVVSAELFGRALAYSLNIDRALSAHITAGVGIAVWQTSDWWQNYEATVTVVPIYANYYFSERPRRGFISVGADWISVTNSGFNNDTFTNNGFAAVIGGGYEYRENSGFILRLGGYLIAGRTVTANPSVTLGYAF